MRVFWRVAALVFAVGLAAPGSAQTEAPLAPGKAFRDCEVCPEMVVIPEGSFVMGAVPGEPWAHEAEEGPPHEVHIPGFAMAATELTFAEWDACVADGGCDDYEPEDNGYGRGDNPVIHVSWLDAQLYVAWLNTKAPGVAFRLPTESEWEYAARAGTASPFWTGRTITPEQANYNSESAYNGGPTAPRRRKTTPARSLPANPWGLYDMAGNVWEWCADCWNQTYEGAPTDGSAWATGDCNEAPMRGGAFSEQPQALRSANRFYLPRDGRYFKVGFRLARSLTP